MKSRNCFSLSELLITLVAVGIVAALTIPTLWANIGSKVKDNKQKVFNAKFIKGLNLTKSAGDLNSSYSSTYDFLVNGLSPNFKMMQICDTQHISDCIPYSEIKYEKGADKKEKAIKVIEINTPAKLKLTGGFKDVAAFISADGIPVILSYNLDCITDSGKADTEISSCVAGIYDLNGNNGPNKFGTIIENNKTVFTSDIYSFNGATVGDCKGIIDGLCIAYSVSNKHDSWFTKARSAIEAVDPSYTIPIGTSWGAPNLPQIASDYCTKVVGGAHVPDNNELARIASVLYDIEISPTKGYNFTADTPINNHARESFEKNKAEFTQILDLVDNDTNCYWSGPRCFEPNISRLGFTNGVHDPGAGFMCIGE